MSSPTEINCHVCHQGVLLSEYSEHLKAKCSPRHSEVWQYFIYTALTPCFAFILIETLPLHTFTQGTHQVTLKRKNGMVQLWRKDIPPCILKKIYQIDDIYTQLHISPDHTHFNTLNQMIF